VYDSDIPEYAVAIDLYGKWAYVQEYEPPKTIDSEKRAERLQDVRAVLPEAFAMDARDIFFRVRMRQKGSSQYRKLSDAGSFHEVREGQYKFLVNFTDYLDAGLFLDHRITRALIGESAQGRHFLNLFAYTGTATVYAAGGGAATTTSVDSSMTYLSWAQKNLALNGFGGSTHTFDCADCMEWLKTEERRFGLIFLDPPTFSNSKDREHDFDLQRDCIELIRLAARHLERNGILVFSNNFRRFKLDIEALAPLKIKNITAATIPQDFARNPRIHNCWKITHK
jgi:23S rRNA (guanine2445-N2)-methyltransferase / 23S rRNA (guanine2069-N7)-methyltransferase